MRFNTAKVYLVQNQEKEYKKMHIRFDNSYFTFSFFICHSNIMYGYGKGFSTPGEIIGLFSIINVSYNMAFILIGLIYAVLWLVMILKYNMSKRTILKPNKRITFIAIILGISVEVMGICKFIFTSELSLLYLFSIAFFWMFNLFNYIALKVKNLNN